MKVLRQLLWITGKDLLIEWRSPARTSGLFFFALAIVVLVAFATGPGASALRRQAPGTLWMGLLLASTRSLDRSFAVETEQGALEGLVLWPVDAVAIYYGKAVANTLVLLLVAAALTPLVIAMYDAPIKGSLVQYVALLVTGCAAIAAPGTMYALITSQARAASVLLPVLLFPLVAPALLAAARGTSVIIEGDPMHQAPAWIGLLVAFNLVHWTVSGLLFARVLEDP
jgi:heme exporter protein B